MGEGLERRVGGAGVEGGRDRWREGGMRDRWMVGLTDGWMEG